MSEILVSWLKDPDVAVKLQLLHNEYLKLSAKQLAEMVSKNGQICDYERGFIAAVNAVIKLPEQKIKNYETQTKAETSEPASR